MKNLKIKLIVAALAISLVIIAATTVTDRLESLTQSAAITETAPLPAVYTLADYNGRLAIYEGARDTPVEVFDIFSSSLPEEEYQRVMRGVTVSGEEELQKLIEAYTG